MTDAHRRTVALTADGVSQALRRPARAARRLLRAPRPASGSRSSGPTAPARRRCCRSSRARSSRAAARCRSTPAARSAGSRSSRRSTRSSRSPRTCGCSRASRRCADVDATVDADARADRPARPRRRRGRRAVGRQPPAREHRDRPALRARRCCCSTSRPRRSTRASASACGSSSAASPTRGTTVVYSTHNVAEAERYADRVLVLADGELLFSGRPRELERTVGGDADARLRARLRPLPARARPLTAALAAAQGPADPAPLAAAGRRCWSSTPSLVVAADRPRALVRPEQADGRLRQPRRRPTTPRSRSAASKVDASQYADKLFESVDPIRVKTREEAIDKVRSGEALARAGRAGRRHAEAAGHARARRRRPPDGRGLLQRRGPAQAPVRRVDTINARSPTPTRPSRQRSCASAAKYLDVIVTRREGRAADRRATSTSSACERSRAIIERHARDAARGRAAARRARAGLALRRARGRQPRHLEADPALDRLARCASSRR